jgi:hypothetical protein
VAAVTLQTRVICAAAGTGMSGTQLADERAVQLERP